MTTRILIELAVGEPVAGDSGVVPVPLDRAALVARESSRAGVSALRIADAVNGRATLDPTVVASLLAAREADLGWLVDVPTTHQAPYNVARRILSLDRATAGRAGIVLRPGAGDEVSDAATPDASAPLAATSAARRWAEYVTILTSLWESFPRQALLGDQENEIVADDTQIRPIAHEGRFYRVAGPLDGPSSVQGRPLVVAGDVDVVGWSSATAVADVVVVDERRTVSAEAELTAALERAGRRRDEVVLLGRVEIADPSATSASDLAASLAERAARGRFDGLVLVPTGGEADVLSLVRDVVPLLVDTGARRTSTLRGALGLREVAPVLA